MTIKFILDTREKYLQTYFDKNNVSYDTKQLDLGDILILYSKGVIKDKTNELSSNAKKLLKIEEEKEEENEIYTIVFERKSYTDLKASMSDNRYHEQKSRYKQLPKWTMYYILENNDPEFIQLGKKQFLGTYVHTMIRDNIPVFLTNSLEETYDYLIKIGETLEKFGIETVNNCVIIPEATQIKKKKTYGKDVYKQQICCFPGISSGKAESIANIYPNMKSLTLSIEQNTFKVKGIGKVLINNIKESLLL